ncbi:MAG: lysophospholipase [Dehalococcoidales bacterium]|nr:lysophospholipase [Dehalococcoidales bacterium]
MKHLEGSVKGCDGLDLYYQGWLPDGQPKAILLVVHGLGEHSGRYGNLVNHFVPAGYGVYSYDHRGHGKSAGVKGYVDRFSNFTDDLDIILELVRTRHPGVKTFLIGHSIGGLVSTAYTIKHQHMFDGLILSGAILSPPADASAALIFAARILSVILPKAGLYFIDAEGISQDRNVVNAYINDPLVYQGKVRARLGVELLKTMDMVVRLAAEIRLPVLIMHGSADRLASPEGSKMLYREVNSVDKTLKIYQGYWHEIFNEPGRDQVLADVASWLDMH